MICKTCDQLLTVAEIESAELGIDKYDMCGKCFDELHREIWDTLGDGFPEMIEVRW